MREYLNTENENITRNQVQNDIKLSSLLKHEREEDSKSRKQEHKRRTKQAKQKRTKHQK